MSGTQAGEKEFNHGKIKEYSAVAVGILFLLFWERMFGAWLGLNPWFATLRCLLAILLLLLGTSMTVKFIECIPKSSAGIYTIFATCFLLILNMILAFAVLFHQLYRSYDGVSFTGESLSEGDFLYFSVMTFTSTGYGDIAPKGSLANTAAATEMLFGFFTGTLFMATLVWKLIQQERKGET